MKPHNTHMIVFPDRKSPRVLVGAGGQKGGTGSRFNRSNESGTDRITVLRDHPIDIRLRELGMTHRELAFAVHRTVQTIRLYCNRKLMIDPDSYLGREFCRVLQTDFSFLIMGVRKDTGRS